MKKLDADVHEIERLAGKPLGTDPREFWRPGLGVDPWNVGQMYPREILAAYEALGAAASPAPAPGDARGRRPDEDKTHYYGRLAHDARRREGPPELLSLLHRDGKLSIAETCRAVGQYVALQYPSEYDEYVETVTVDGKEELRIKALLAGELGKRFEYHYRRYREKYLQNPGK